MNINIKEFQDLNRSIEALSEQWKNKAKEIDSKQTLFGFQTAMQNDRKFLLNEKKDSHAKINARKDLYSPFVIADEIKQVDGSFDKLSKAMTEKTSADIADLFIAKTKALEKMMVTPPTDNQMRLLSAIQMRGKDIDLYELTTAMPLLFENYQAMKILQHLGKESGIEILLPSQLNTVAMKDTLERAEKYMLEAAKFIGADSLPLNWHAFYLQSDKNTPLICHDPQFREYIETIDSVPQLNKVKLFESTLSQREKTILSYLYGERIMAMDRKDSTNFDTFFAKTQKILTDHPDMEALIKRTDFKDFIPKAEKVETDDTKQNIN